MHTVGRLEDLRALLAAPARRPRVVLERLTSMRRHGFSARDLREPRPVADRRRGRGSRASRCTCRSAQGSHLAEVHRLMNDVVAAGLPDPHRVCVSHLTDAELAALRAALPRLRRSARGSAPTCGSATAARCGCGATVLDVHPVERGDVFGYRGRTAPKHGHILVVVSGGTAHGIGLEAPTGGASLKDRAAAALASGGLDAAGFVRSPYTIDGKQRLFAEPPHMQASMLFLPARRPRARGRRRGRRPGPLHRHHVRPDRHQLTPTRDRRRARRCGSIGSSVSPSARTGSCHGRRMSRTTTTAM